MGKFVDFDAAFAEQRHEPVIARLYGQDWELHDSLPAAVLLRVLRMQADPGTEVSVGELFEIITQLVPEAVLDAWTERGLTIDQFEHIVQMLTELYMGGDDPGEATPPNRAARRQAAKRSPSRGSSNAGQRSKRTSSASTGST